MRQPQRFTLDDLGKIVTANINRGFIAFSLI
jgi:hypothetical protein